MTNEKTAIANEGTTGAASPSCSPKSLGPKSLGPKAAKSFISDERRILDALEDDEVREVLRGFHQVPEHRPAKKCG